MHTVFGCREPAGALTQDEHGREDVLESVWVDREDVGPAPQIPQRLVHDRHIDRAGRTQILGHHQVGVQLRQGLRLEAVEVLTPGQGNRDEVVDLTGGEALGHGRGGHDARGTGLGGRVARKGHPHHVRTGADPEEDLGRRGEQGPDAHGAMLRPPRVTPCPPDWTTSSSP